MKKLSKCSVFDLKLIFNFNNTTIVKQDIRSFKLYDLHLRSFVLLHNIRF